MRVNSLTLLASSSAFLITNRLKLLRNVSAIEVKLAEAELRNQERLLIRDVESATRTHFKLKPAPDLSWMSMVSSARRTLRPSGKIGSKKARHQRST